MCVGINFKQVTLCNSWGAYIFRRLGGYGQEISPGFLQNINNLVEGTEIGFYFLDPPRVLDLCTQKLHRPNRVLRILPCIPSPTTSKVG